MYPQASPLIHDSRKWTYKYEGGSKEPSLPGTSDDHSFPDSVFYSIKRRLCLLLNKASIPPTLVGHNTYQIHTVT